MTRQRAIPSKFERGGAVVGQCWRVSPDAGGKPSGREYCQSVSAVSVAFLVVGLASWLFGVVCVQKARRLYYAQGGLEAESRGAPLWQRRLFGAKVELLPSEARRLIIPSWLFIAAGGLCIAIALLG